MKLKLLTLIVLSSAFVAYGQETNEKRIDRINEIIQSTMPENILALEKSEVQLDGCELILTEYLDNNTTDEERFNLKSSTIELVKLGTNPDEFDSPFWIIEVDFFQIGFDIYNKTIAIELYNLLLKLKNNCE